MILLFLAVPNILKVFLVASVIHFLVALVSIIARDPPVLTIYAPNTVRKYPGPRNAQKPYLVLCQYGGCIVYWQQSLFNCTLELTNKIISQVKH